MVWADHFDFRAVEGGFGGLDINDGPSTSTGPSEYTSTPLARSSALAPSRSHPSNAGVGIGGGYGEQLFVGQIQNNTCMGLLLAMRIRGE